MNNSVVRIAVGVLLGCVAYAVVAALLGAQPETAGEWIGSGIKGSLFVVIAIAAVLGANRRARQKSKPLPGEDTSTER